MTQLVIENLAKDFGKGTVLSSVDLKIADREMLVIVGASGCGKSTLLRLVAGLETPSAGRVVLDGRDITHLDPAERDIAMVFQNYALYPHMNVFENMAYGLKVRRVPKAEIARRVDEAAALLNLAGLLGRRPRELSGGQRQRVAMGRAIVREPKLFLFDEPLSNLDAKLRVQMRAEIRRLQRRLGVTSLYVTHDQVEAMTLGDRLVVMNRGHVAQIATPMEIFERPADTYVAGFIGAPAMNFLAAALSHGGSAATLADGRVIPFADGRRDGSDGRHLTLGIRPEHVRPMPNGMRLMVELVEPLGSETLVHGRLSDETALTVKLSGGGFGAGVLDIMPETAFLHVFDAETGLRMAPSAADVPAALAGAE